MKNIIRYIACGLSAFLMTACGDMYEIHEKYLEMGEETYLGAVQDLSAYSGFNRVKLEWYLNADPRINSCVITWEGNENPFTYAEYNSFSISVTLPSCQFYRKNILL